jgi:hypothetical protein
MVHEYRKAKNITQLYSKPKYINMKKLLSLLLLTVITVTAYAEKNHKAVAKNKTIKPKLQEQTATPANNDTAWHGTGNHYDYSQRELDPRIGRSMYVAPSAQPPTNNPYQGTTNNPVKPVKE